MWAFKVRISHLHMIHDPFRELTKLARGYQGGVAFGHFERAPRHPEGSIPLGAVIFEGTCYNAKVIPGWPAIQHVPGDTGTPELRIASVWGLNPDWIHAYRILIQAGPRLLSGGEVVLEYPGFESVAPNQVARRVALGILDQQHVLVAARDHTMPGMAEWMKQLGCRDALAGTGGPTAGLVLADRTVYGETLAVANAVVWDHHEILVTPEWGSRPGDVDFRLTQDFDIREFACPHCSRVMLSPGFENLVSRLQGLRTRISRPLVVTSGYRCEAYNSRLPGASPNSLHMRGIAADIQAPGLSPGELAGYARLFFNDGGIGLYETHVHVDVGPARRW